MKALIFSDSHRDLSGIYAAMDENRNVDLIIHAGDVQKDVEEIMLRFTKTPCAYVLGNNDFFVHNVPTDRLFEFGGVKIFLTHGHNYNVKASPSRVISEAKARGADICIFGHTHTKYTDYADIWAVNPGSARKGYAILTVENGNINIEQRII